MLQALKEESNTALTENGAVTYASTLSDCLDLFAVIGALRDASDDDICVRFLDAYREDPDLAMKILFFARDVRGGLGERRVFRVLCRRLADYAPDSMRKNITRIPAYGRYDDLLALLGTPCEEDALRLIKEQWEEDMSSDASDGAVSLLAKWLPSVNASNEKTVRMGKRVARALGMTDAQYRKALARLRRKIQIIENHLREKDYTFDYEKQPSRAMFKYRQAFCRNDAARYEAYLDSVQKGTATMHTDALMPYDIITPCFDDWMGTRKLSASERKTMEVTWNALPDFAGDENALVVVDGSGSMYMDSSPKPIAVALSLGIYFAERNTGAFRGHFITFSETPRLVEIKGKDIADKVCYCARFNDVANTDLAAVFRLILDAAARHAVPQEEMPKRLYIVSDMEFDGCAGHADETNFAYAKKLFEDSGYHLPEVVFWNVCSRHRQQPVTRNEAGVALVSGCTPRLFSSVAGGTVSPYAAMMEILSDERYADISA